MMTAINASAVAFVVFICNMDRIAVLYCFVVLCAHVHLSIMRTIKLKDTWPSVYVNKFTFSEIVFVIVFVFVDGMCLLCVFI